LKQVRHRTMDKVQKHNSFNSDVRFFPVVLHGCENRIHPVQWRPLIPNLYRFVRCSSWKTFCHGSKLATDRT